MVALFSYKNENTIFHKISEKKKIIFIFIFSLTIFLVPLKVCVIFFLTIFTLSFFAKFSFYEHLGLWKIIFFYAMLLFFSKLLSLKFDSTQTSGQKFFLSDILFLVRFATIFYATSIFYKTTSVISIKNSLEDFEKKCLTLFGKKNAKPFFSLTFSLLLTFIPLIFLTWENLKKLGTTVQVNLT